MKSAENTRARTLHLRHSSQLGPRQTWSRTPPKRMSKNAMKYSLVIDRAGPRARARPGRGHPDPNAQKATTVVPRSLCAIMWVSISGVSDPPGCGCGVTPCSGTVPGNPEPTARRGLYSECYGVGVTENRSIHILSNVLCDGKTIVGAMASYWRPPVTLAPVRRQPVASFFHSLGHWIASQAPVTSATRATGFRLFTTLFDYFVVGVLHGTAVQLVNI